MIDCVVFPSKGDRPHPDEMSGSDLDGDMYFVCWEETLLPPEANREPMNYKPKPKHAVYGPVTEVNFIGSYIDGDKLGVIANSHLAHADADEKGIFSDNCLQLAQMHSDAVDFPKTGYVVNMPFELRPQRYPHYMRKRDKEPYKSKHIIGKLFDICDNVASAKHYSRQANRYIDHNFILAGHEMFAEAAKRLSDYYCRHVFGLMTEYGIETEA